MCEREDESELVRQQLWSKAAATPQAGRIWHCSHGNGFGGVKKNASNGVTEACTKVSGDAVAGNVARFPEEGLRGHCTE